MKHLKFILFLSSLFLLPTHKTPAQQYTPPEIEISQELVRIEGELFYLHNVKRRETLYSISRAYGVSEDVIQKDNPKLSEGLKEGDFIYIRQAGQLSGAGKEVNEDVIETDSRDYLRIETTHTVRWYETLTSIARRYGVSEELILYANSLTNTRLTSRQQLKIPYPGQLIPNSENPELDIENQESNPEDIYLDNKGLGRLNIFNRPAYNETTVSLLLSLGSTIDTSLVNPNNSHIEFYMGFLIAVEELREVYPSMELEVRCFDMTNYLRETELITSGALQGSDIIIGPVFSEYQRPFIDYAERSNALFVSPLDSKSEIYTSTYANFFQVTTPLYFQQSSLLATLAGKSNILLFYEEGSSDTSLFNLTIEILTNHNIPYKTFSYGTNQGRTIGTRMEAALNATETNHVIIASNSEAFVSDVMRNLHTIKLMRGVDITVYGTSNWRTFESLDINYYHSLNLHVAQQYFIDYQDERVKSFVLKFRSLYHSEPGAYAFQAYDIADYFIGGLYRLREEQGSNYLGEKLLQSDYGFIIRQGEMGYTNTGVRHLIYKPDYSVEIRASF